MKLNSLVTEINGIKLTKDYQEIKKIDGVYVGDLLSRVMANAKEGDIWITIQTHINVIAVAVLKDIPLILIPEGITIPNETIQKAEKEEISIIVSPLSAFELCCICRDFLLS